jgi:hypothetical protein
MAIKELPLIQAKLGADSLKLMNEGKTDTRYLGAPLRPADVDRISTLATLLIPDCQPITVRGLSSSSQIDIPNASAFPWQVDESNECGNRSDCLNTRLANRRADLIAHLLSSANVLVTVKHWAEKDYSLLVDAQFDDLDPPTDPAADPEAKKKAVANRYIIPRGVLNRSVEIIPEGKSCDFDRIQRRLAIMLLERPY